MGVMTIQVVGRISEPTCVSESPHHGGPPVARLLRRVNRIRREMSPGQWHELRLKVAFTDVDMFQIAHTSKYIIWFEMGRIELSKEIGIPLADLFRKGFGIAVAEVKLTFLAPSRYDDELLVKTRVVEVGTTSAKLECEISNLTAGKIACKASGTFVFVDRSGAPVQLPEDISQKLTAS